MGFYDVLNNCPWWGISWKTPATPSCPTGLLLQVYSWVVYSVPHGTLSEGFTVLLLNLKSPVSYVCVCVCVHSQISRWYAAIRHHGRFHSCSSDIPSHPINTRTILSQNLFFATTLLHFLATWPPPLTTFARIAKELTWANSITPLRQTLLLFLPHL